MKISCIYLIINIMNNKLYIGSSRNFKQRINRHYNSLKNNQHHSILLQRSWDKWKVENFYIVIFPYNKNELLIKEKEYMDYYKPELNVSKDPVAPMMGRKHKEETKLKWKNNRVYKKGKEHHLFNRPLSEDHINQIVERQTGSKRSDKTKKKMSETAKRINAISRIDHSKQQKMIEDSNGVRYDSLTKASKETGISISAICDNLKGRSKKTKKGLTFKYV